MALLPGDDVKHSGDQEEGTQAQAVHPGSDPLPAVIRQAMQQRHAHDGQPNEGLQRWTEEKKKKITQLLKQRASMEEDEGHMSNTYLSLDFFLSEFRLFL